MIVNIAFNTIIYIMVFLFPGIIFRRTFFSGKFRNNFDSGSNFERLLWSILISVFSIFLFCFVIITVDGLTNNLFSGFVHVGEKEILQIFEDLYSNKYPTSFRDKNSILGIIEVFIFLYFFSGFIGWLFKKAIFTLKLEKSVSFLKFENHWDYLAGSNRINNPSHRFGDRSITQVDIKTLDDQLFTGLFHQFLLDKDGAVDSIVITDTFKYFKLNKPEDLIRIEEIKLEATSNTGYIIEHLETELQYIYKKKIKGHIFIAFKSEIDNISITYITLSNVFNRFQDVGKIIFTILIGLAIIFSLSFAFWDFGLFNFKSNWKRIGFSLTSVINIIFFLLFLGSLLRIRLITDENRILIKNSIWNSFILLLFTLIPYLYIFGFLQFYVIIIVMIVLLPLLGVLLKKQYL